jgi:hypothetical protein
MPRARKSDRFSNYDTSVFVNCPFDSKYAPIFESIVFAVAHCGFRARCALEIDDASQVRIDRIFSIMEECRLGIHDLSRTQLEKVSRLPRFNMPLELGMFLGVKRSGDARQKAKLCLVLDSEPYRYQRFISDVAGQDIRSHFSRQKEAVSITRNWLQSCSGRSMPGGTEVYRQYRQFRRDLPRLCEGLKLDITETTFNDFTNIVALWLKAEAASRAV